MDSTVINIISIIVNVLAIMAAPIVSVYVSQKLQDRSKKRQDKMEIFKALMTSRIYGWSPQSVDALNTIEVVFSDDEAVKKQWKIYYDKLTVENPTETDLGKIKIEREKLLEEMGRSLGYKDKISWEAIQNPYIPKGMIDSINNQQQYQNNQLQIMDMMMKMFANGGGTDGQNENGNKKRNNK